MNELSPRRPAVWTIVLAFAYIYVSWGTTYLAIKKGVEHLPPALFGGVRIATAGLVLLGILALCGVPLRLSWRDFCWIALVGVLLFVGGNGLITFGEQYVASGAAAVLVATTPLWIALAERFWPQGECLAWRGWLGLFLGLAGVLVLLAPRLQAPGELFHDAGPLLILVSSMMWALGTVVLRHRRLDTSPVVSAALQMAIGGGCLALLGVATGELGQLTAESFAPAAVSAFFYLLIVSSLVGFVAYTWLLGQVPASLVGTYAYVNPVVAIVVGWLLGGEAITLATVGGMAVILAGVALVRSGGPVAEAQGGDEVQEPTGELSVVAECAD